MIVDLLDYFLLPFFLTLVFLDTQPKRLKFEPRVVVFDSFFPLAMLVKISSMQSILYRRKQVIRNRSQSAPEIYALLLTPTLISVSLDENAVPLSLKDTTLIIQVFLNFSILLSRLQLVL